MVVVVVVSLRLARHQPAVVVVSVRLAKHQPAVLKGFIGTTTRWLVVVVVVSVRQVKYQPAVMVVSVRLARHRPAVVVVQVTLARHRHEVTRVATVAIGGKPDSNRAKPPRTGLIGGATSNEVLDVAAGRETKPVGNGRPCTPWYTTQHVMTCGLTVAPTDWTQHLGLGQDWD